MKQSGMKILRGGRVASGGIAIGSAYVVAPFDDTPSAVIIKPEDAERELLRFDHAVKRALAQLEPLARNDDVFAAHMELVSDPELRDGVAGRIRTGCRNAEAALCETIGEYTALMNSLEAAYLKERAADLCDVKRRLLLALRDTADTPLSGIHAPCIVIAQDLTPSDTACMNPNLVLGFATEGGGLTGHVAIIARSMGLPALVGMPGLLRCIQTDSPMILDGVRGLLIVNPTGAVLSEYTQKLAEQRREAGADAALCALAPVTKDGQRVRLEANAGSPAEVERALAYGIDGIGLFRTEFLFLGSRTLPSEEEQFGAYRRAAELLGTRVLTIRTLDIGGDKHLPCIKLPQEENPFLGCRGIRVCLDRPELFKVQLRAILRAAAFGHVRVMFPMIASVEELQRARALLNTCAKELAAEGRAFDAQLRVGIMIETPAAVFMSGELAEAADFFSIGTNDLTQYVLSVDRGNGALSALCSPFHPAVLRAIFTVCAAARKAGIHAGVCGELAGDAFGRVLLLGMGVTELSMSLSAIPKAHADISALDMEDAAGIATEALACASTAAVLTLCREKCAFACK